MKPTLQEQHEDLKERYEPLWRAAVRLTAAFDPQDPEEVANLIQDLAHAAGLGGQLHAIAVVEGWHTPVRSSHAGERMQQVTTEGRTKR